MDDKGWKGAHTFLFRSGALGLPTCPRPGPQPEILSPVLNIRVSSVFGTCQLIKDGLRAKRASSNASILESGH